MMLKFFKVFAFAMMVGAAGVVAAQDDLDLPDNPDRVLYTPDGEEVRQYQMTVLAVGRRHITVEFTDGTRHTYRVPNDFRFNIDGVETPLSGIYPRQQLRAYFYYTGGAWRLADPDEYADAGPEVIVVETVAERAPEEDLVPVAPAPAMPRTAGTLPLVAFLGGLLLLAAGGLRLARVTRR